MGSILVLQPLGYLKADATLFRKSKKKKGGGRGKKRNNASNVVHANDYSFILGF